MLGTIPIRSSAIGVNKRIDRVRMECRSLTGLVVFSVPPQLASLPLFFLSEW